MTPLTGILAGVTLLAVTLAFFVLVRAGKWVVKYELERERHAVARWLAGYNFALMAGAQDTACEMLGLSYAKFEDRVRERLGRARPQLDLGQVVPLDRVPAALRDAALRYNNYPFRAVPVGPSDWEVGRTRRLEAALAVVVVQLPNEYAASVARTTGLSYTQAWNALDSVRSLLERDLRAKLGALDPESVLPGRY